MRQAPEITRNEEYTTILKEYSTSYKQMRIQRVLLKYIFFAIVCICFVVVVVVSSIFTIKASGKIGSFSLEDFGAVLASFGTLISSLIVLPRVIAEHLFPNNIETSDVSMIKAMQQFDTRPDHNEVIESIELENNDEESVSENSTSK